MSDRPNRVVVFDYDPGWPATFERLRRPVWDAVGDIAQSIEHVGSTAVPGLAAKPIIDMDVIVRTRSDISTIIGRLARIGYRHRGDLGIEDREAFESPPGTPAHHLYACVLGSVALRNHLAVRDRLRSSRSAVEAYGRLKKSLAERFPDDPAGYTVAKTDFILELLAHADLPDDLLATIRTMNLPAPDGPTPMEREIARTRCVGDDGSPLLVVEYQLVDRRRTAAGERDYPGARRLVLDSGEPVRPLGDGLWEVIATGEMVRRA